MVSVTSFEKEIRLAAQKGEESQALHALDGLKRLLQSQESRYPAKVKHGVSSILVSLVKGLEGTISQEEYDRMLNSAYEMYGTCDSFDRLFEISKSLLVNVCAAFGRSGDGYDAVENCILYIKNHLHEDVSLQLLADQAHFHPNYLSAQIKNRVGMSYSGYVLLLRMELACKLLTDTSLLIQAVAGKCGFKDNSYFNRVFRKTFGLSPEQYRKVHKKC